jgi:hypothetical protein
VIEDNCMGRRKANILLAKAVAELTHEKNPEARIEAKREGIEVGARVAYEFGGGSRYGVVREMHHKGVDIEQTAGGLLPGGENMVVRDDKMVPFANIHEVLGPGRLAVRVPETKKSASPPPPPREKGYEKCDIGDCEKRPAMAYQVRKYDREIKELGMLGLPHIVALCKEHDEQYEEASNPNKGGIMQTPAHFPLLWQMGVASEEWRVPPPVGAEIEKPVRVPPPRPKKTAAEIVHAPPPRPKKEADTPSVSPSQGRHPRPPARKKEAVAPSDSPPRPLTDSPYEGVRGRHPRLCDCSRCMVVA